MYFRKGQHAASNLQKCFSIPKTFFLMVSQDNFRNKIPVLLCIVCKFLLPQHLFARCNNHIHIQPELAWLIIKAYCEIVLFIQIDGILFPKLFWPTVRKKCFSDRKKTFEILSFHPRICKKFEITKTICSKTERSEQFLVTECFFNLFLEVSQIL